MSVPQGRRLSDERVPPQNLEAERYLLGAVMLSQEILPEVLEIIDAADFYHSGNRLVFKVIRDLYEKQEPADIVTISDHLKKSGELDKLGGIAHLHSLYESVPTSANARYYARIIRDASKRRSLIRAGGEIAEAAFESEDAEKASIKAQEIIYEIAQKSHTGGIRAASEVATEFYARLLTAPEDGIASIAVQTKYPGIDNLITGFFPANLILLAARPSVGKTSLALNIAWNVASRLDRGVVIFSMEMNEMDIVSRLLSFIGQVDSTELRSQNVKDPAALQRLNSSINEMAKHSDRLWIDEASSLTVAEIGSKARRLKGQQGLSLIIIDYLGLIQPDHASQRMTRNEQVTRISGGLKSLARELNIPILALSQLSRDPEKRKGKKAGSGRPQLADLRDSGSLEQDADIVFLMYHEEGAEEEGAEAVESDEPMLVNLDIAKHRNGPTTRKPIKLVFEPKYTRFSSYAEEGRGF